MRSLLAALLLCLLCAGCSTTSYSLHGNPISLDETWDSRLRVIKAAEAAGTLDMALTAARKELDERPENAEARVIMARLQTRSGRPDQALAVLEPLKGAPSPESRVEEARALLAQDRPGEAKGILTAVTQSNPSAVTTREANKLVAICTDLEGNHPSAQNMYKALLAERDEVGVRYNLGRSLLAGKQYAEAAATLMPLVDIQALPQARLAAAAALAKSNRKQEAAGLLQGHMPQEQIDRLLAES